MLKSNKGKKILGQLVLKIYIDSSHILKHLLFYLSLLIISC